jgi:two-component system sensor histidine kinase/response regulator
VNAFGHSKLKQSEVSSVADAVLIKPISRQSLHDSLREVLVANAKTKNTEAHSDHSNGDARPCIEGAYLLLVEDNPLNQIVARGMLEQAGAKIDIVDNGQKGVDILRENPDRYDLVLMDVQMPVMDGFTATRAIRNELKLLLPVLAMTAGVMKSEKDQCIASGMNDFIAKPIEVEQMYATISRHLQAWQESKNNNSGVAQTSAHSGQTSDALTATETLPIKNEKKHETALPQASTSAASAASPDHEKTAPLSFDSSQLMALCASNPAYREPLMKLILETTDRSPEQIQEAKSAWQDGRLTDAARILHTMRGSLGQIGAKQFSMTSLALEAELKEGGSEKIPLLFETAEKNLADTTRLARAWLAEQDPSRSS